MLNIAIKSDNYIELSGLVNALAPTVLISTAVVVVTLLDRSGVAISGQAWPLPMPAVGGSPGTYRGQLSKTLVLAAGRHVNAHVVTTTVDGLVLDQLLPCVAVQIQEAP